MVVSDRSKVVIFNSKSGAIVHKLVLPKLFENRVDYRVQDYIEQPSCANVKLGHTNFAFSEDGIILFHKHRHFPIAADVLLFW